jgi:hypothetical protein
MSLSLRLALGMSLGLCDSLGVRLSGMCILCLLRALLGGQLGPQRVGLHFEGDVLSV